LGELTLGKDVSRLQKLNEEWQQVVSEETMEELRAEQGKNGKLARVHMKVYTKAGVSETKLKQL